MIGVKPLCESCERLRRTGNGYTCDAFPDGIPTEIAVEGYDHRKPFPGDRGLQFVQDTSQPVPDAPKGE